MAQAAPETAIAERPNNGAGLVRKFAERYSVEPERLLHTLKQTCFKQQNDKQVTNEQMVALLVVADQYRLNPFTKEIFAFDDKKAGIVPVVSVDGWSRIINEHPEYDGVDFRWSEDMVTMTAGKPCPEWCEAVIYRKDRRNPIVVREYLDEVYRPPMGQNQYHGPWQTHTKRMLRHKALIQGARVAFGFAGIYDQDEAERIVEAQVVSGAPERSTSKPPQAQAGRSSVVDSLVKGDEEITDVADADDGTNAEGQGDAKEVSDD